MSTQIVEFKPSTAIMEMAEQCRTIAGIDMGVARIFARATKVNAIRTMMAHPEMQKIILPLAGNPAGFYIGKGDEAIVNDAKGLASIVTEAVSRGARLDGGEFTVMKGRAFLNKPFYQRQLDELGKERSFTEDCKYEMMWWDRRTKEVLETGATVQVIIEIEYCLRDKSNGNEIKKVESFTCWLRKFSTDTPDKWVGQAERRAFQTLLRKLTSVDFGEDEDDTPATVAAPGPAVPIVGKVSTAPQKTNPAPTVPNETQVSDAEVVAKAAPELASAVADFAKHIVGEATAVANPAPRPTAAPTPEPVAAKAEHASGEDPLKRFYAAHAALKALKGLPVCSQVLAEAGFAGKVPSKHIPPESLVLLAERMERITAGKEAAPVVAAAKPSAPAVDGPPRTVGAPDTVYPADKEAATPARPKTGSLF